MELHKSQLMFTGIHRQRLQICQGGGFTIVHRTFETSSPLIPSKTISFLKPDRFQFFFLILPDSNALSNIRLQHKTNENDDSMLSIDKVCNVHSPVRCYYERRDYIQGPNTSHHNKQSTKHFETEINRRN